MLLVPSARAGVDLNTVLDVPWRSDLNSVKTYLNIVEMRLPAGRMTGCAARSSPGTTTGRLEQALVDEAVPPGA